MNFDNYKFRASGVGNLMIEPRSKSELLSETTKSYLLECYVSEVFGRRKDITSKFLEKGLAVEENAIDLYSEFTKDFYSKNEIRFGNDFIKGTPDIVVYNDYGEATIIIDIKSSFDIFTFSKSMKEENKMYYWQLQAYMALTGAKEAILAYCLVDTPESIIDREIKKALYQSGLDANTESFKQYSDEMNLFYKYSDIPKNKRVFTKHYSFDQSAIDSLYSRIKDCRNYLNSINW